MPSQSNRNLIIFMVVAMAILFIYQFAVIDPRQKAINAQRQKEQAVAAKTQGGKPGAATLPGQAAPQVLVSREQALGAAAERRPIQTSALKGSLSLRGGRIDDLELLQYADQQGQPQRVRLLSPAGAKDAWYAEFGWAGPNVPGLPTDATVWTVKSGDVLAPGKPLVLTYTSPQNLVFTRTFQVDDKYLFTVTDSVVNNSGAAVTLGPYGRVKRVGLPAQPPGHPALGGNGIVHEGAIGISGPKGDKLEKIKYPDWRKKGEKLQDQNFAQPAWIGITDKYWLVAVSPVDRRATAQGSFRAPTGSGDNTAYDAYYSFGQDSAPTVQPGATVTQKSLLFAGAKTVPVIEGYQKANNLPNFINAIDWGMLKVLTQPFFRFLEFLYRGVDPAGTFPKIFTGVGNFGLAILALTVCVRLILFPLANKSYESMSRMKKLQPQLEELKAKHKDDPAKHQQEMMALYQREKINPMMGCLPLLVQIPVFFAVYKVLSVTIEMRHAPFYGWIKDLSSQDPTTIWNLFGLIPWDPTSVSVFGFHLFTGYLHLGVLPLLYGFTMWLTTAMNPPAPDPMQQRIFSLMPIMFTFIMATFPVGLLIYWTWSNVLSILQQYVIMHRLKVDNPIDDFLKRFTQPKEAAG